ncbi:MAG: ABC transporter ATP-binding protein [Methanosarcinales archaeon]|nr:ABC transporter ATP-binding protein [ANME-2 cluster archaeon]MDW7776040.1 ABC transporter ATP-binding protein [Methanosarcinales archaeon]
MITVDGLFKKYGKTLALNDASLHVSEGTIHGLIGPNGAGKSTTLKILSTLVRPTKGEVSIGGVPLKKGRAIRQQIGVVPETPRLHEYLTAQEEIMSYARLSGLSRARATDRVNTVIKQLDLAMVQNQKISRFSTGMKKRVALALAMVADPPVLLLDEPMSGLDPVVRRQFKDTILGLEDKTVLVSDHDLYTVDELCTSVTILQQGRTLIEDNIDSLRQKVGKVSVEIKPRDPAQISYLAAELQQMGRVTSVDMETDSVVVSVNDPEKDIPEVIRMAAIFTEIVEARPSRISLEEIFIKLASGGDRT